MSALPEETRRGRDAAWEPTPPPAPSTSPLRTAAAVAVPEYLRALGPYVNQTTTDLARIGPGSRPSDGSPADAKNAEANHHRAVRSSAAQRDLADRLDAARPRLVEPESLFPRADSSFGGSDTAAAPSRTSGRFETTSPHDVASSTDAAGRAPLSQVPLGDSQTFEGRSGGTQGLEGAGAQNIAELATRLLQAAMRLEQLAERYSSQAPRPYRSAPRPFRDRVEG